MSDRQDLARNVCAFSFQILKVVRPVTFLSLFDVHSGLGSGRGIFSSIDVVSALFFLSVYAFPCHVYKTAEDRYIKYLS